MVVGRSPTRSLAGLFERSHVRAAGAQLAQQQLGRATAWLRSTAGGAAALFPLVSHLHTQAEPAWCGFRTLVTVLNALELAAAEGLTLGEVGCLACTHRPCAGARCSALQIPAALGAGGAAVGRQVRA
nr:phytochelatin synthase family protein [Rhodoferax sp.]